MKHSLCALVFVLFALCHAFAQRDPSKEILVYFIEGVVQEKRMKNGFEENRQLIKHDKLKTKLKSMGVEEDMLEIALPVLARQTHLNACQTAPLWRC